MKNAMSGQEGERRTMLIGVVGLVILILIFIIVVYALSSSHDKKLESESGDRDATVELTTNEGDVQNVENNEEQVQKTINKISKHILLPSGQVTVATVNNADGLRESDPLMYRYVKNGDRLLLHPERIIVYDPIQDKIVDVIRLNPQQPVTE